MSRVELVRVLEAARALLARPGNDFTWSSFVDSAAAVEEFDNAMAAVLAGGTPVGLSILFAPTGPIQEVAISSGWGDAFLELAGRFDTAVAGE
ncbi:hypothetical protein GCM10009827_106900 [Dactylosporangium maewongense]|uniref:GNAT family N-acetyltransferase n=1 Tax=Dactylosporangium maewongense TaxID=634393 RepID=A0ABN2D3P3_9ACTN